MYAHQRLLQGLARRAAQGSHRQARRRGGIQAGLEAHETVPPVGNELAATPSLFYPRVGSLNRLLYKPGKLFIRAELKRGREVRWRSFFFSSRWRWLLRSAKNKQVGAFVQRSNLHINYPGELISTSAYPRYLRSLARSARARRFQGLIKNRRADREKQAEPRGRARLRSKFPFLHALYRE